MTQREALTIAAADRLAVSVWAALKTGDPAARDTLTRGLALYEDLRSELPLDAIPGWGVLRERARELTHA